ncbi:YdaU family protein [Burkholderia cenocepacia]|uniref:YdaU family protein n=1 Tax=Burkholderia cenocepacia TaxID=95486 RepID=UPI0022372EC0|nr:YdaU family protein [Burkholderia cenocepacia]
MPLDVGRVIDSDLFGMSTGDEFKTAFRLWAKSWHQVPAASLPNDDRMLAHLAGLVDAPAKWKKVRAMALRGWILCSDGRLYHPVIAQKALEAMGHREVKQDQQGGAQTRQQRLRERRAAMFEQLRAHGIVPDFNASTAELKRLIASIGQSHSDAHASHETSPGTREASHDTSHVTSQGTSPQRLYTTQDNTCNTQGSNDDVRGLIRGDAVDNSPSSSLSPDAIVEHLTRWERDRGKTPRFDVTDAPVATWRVTADQLRKAYDLALAERHRQRDQSAVNSGFLDAFVAKALAPPRVAVKALRSMTDPELEAEARRLGVSTHGLQRDQCIAKLDSARRAAGPTA